MWHSHYIIHSKHKNGLVDHFVKFLKASLQSETQHAAHSNVSPHIAPFSFKATPDAGNTTTFSTYKLNEKISWLAQ